MPLKVWAGRLAEIDPARAPVASLGLHLADTVAALHAGAATREGQALARVYGLTSRRLVDPTSGRPDAAGVAATASTIRLTEIDDIHLETCITTSSVVVPVALAVTAARGAPPEALVRGLVAGYATLLRHGRLIGGAAVLAQGIWPTLVAAPMGAAATASVLLGLSPDRTATALRLALVRSVGRIGQPGPPLPGRWFIFGEAVADGLKAALAAAEGLVADPALESQLLPPNAADVFSAAIDHTEIDSISMKPFCTARQAAAGVVAFRDLLERHKLSPQEIATVEVEVPGAYIGMLSRPLDPTNRLSTLTSQGLQIAAVALMPELLFDIERVGPFPADVLEMARRVTVKATAEFDSHYPRRWPARVTVTMKDGTQHAETRVEIPGDPGKTLEIAQIAHKVRAISADVLADAAAATRVPEALSRLTAHLSR